VGKWLRDITGAMFMEYSIVFPTFIFLLLGTVDLSSMLVEWGLASNAAYIGARTAVVADAVASGITNLQFDSTKTSELCFNPSDGSTTSNCPTITATDCTGAASNGSCTNSYTWNDTPFTTYIFPRMQRVYPQLQRNNVTVSYGPGTYTLGFNGQPQAGDAAGFGALPMNVTVTINKDGSMTHQFYFIGPLLKLFGGGFRNSTVIPSFTTTLPSEAMNSANL
jgi:Flp pilus assembly protein TadG